MSTELQLSFDCEHRTVEERLQLDATKRVLTTSQPIASKGNTQVKANFSNVPRGGLRTPAELVSYFSGPFFIESTARTLQIQTQAETLTVLLPVGERISTQKIADEINKSAQTLFATNLKGHLSLVDLSSTGENSLLSVSGNSVSVFGFDINSRAQGYTVFPGWAIKDGNIIFERRIKENPVFFTSYTTARQFCRRCQGSGREFDPRTNASGRYLEIVNENLLYQASLKILLTERGTNPYHPWYGSTIPSKVGSKAISGIASLLREEVRNSLINLQRLQNEQFRYQEVTQKERMYRVLSVDVLRSEQDPTVFLIDVVVQNAALDPVSVSIVFTNTQLEEFAR